MKKLYAILLLLIVYSNTYSQTLDRKFYITDGEVVNVVPHGNTIYLGGRFNAVGPNTGHAAMLDNATGLWVEGLPNVSGEVDAIEPDGLGGWYIGGSFNYVDDTPVNNLIHIKANKALDNNFRPQPNNPVEALCLYNGTLYVGGRFSIIAGQPRHSAAAFDVATGVLQPWAPNPDNWIMQVKAAKGLVYLLGNFGNAGGQPRGGLAAVDAVTGLANSFSINQNSSSGISAMGLLGDTIYIGGNFLSVNGQSRSQLAALDVNTGIVTSWAPTADNAISYIYGAGKTVYVSGGFDIANGTNHLGLAAFDAVTGVVKPWNAQVIGYNAVGGNISSMVTAGDTLYITGHFSAVAGQPRTNIAAIDVNTGAATNWAPQANANAYTLTTDGKNFYAGGDFTSVNSVTRNYIAALDATTGKVTDWDPKLDGNVHGIAVKGDTVFVAGEFFNIGDSSRVWLGNIDSVTGKATAWNPKLFGRAYSIDIEGNLVYIAGTFSQVAGVDKYDIAALDADSATAKPFAVNINQSLNTVISGIKVTKNVMYIWGSFHSIGDKTRNNIAAVALTTGAATAWDPNADGPVKSLLLSGSNVYVGGAFANIGGQARNGIAKLDNAAGLATAWNPNITGGYVSAIALFNNIVYAGGSFTSAGGSNRYNIAAIDASTAKITGWQPSTNYPPIDVIVPFQSKIMFGGNFTKFAYYSASSFAVAGVAITLPLQLLDFTATSQNNNLVKLNWITAQEINTDHFTVQRGIDGVNFADIATVTATGRAFNNYNYDDASIKGGNVLYYRLKMVDKDAQFVYSKTIAINLHYTAQNFILYPNPVHSQLGLNVTSGKNQKATLVIIDISGKVIQQQYIQLYQGNNNVGVTLNNVAKGMYVAELRMEDKNLSHTFITW